MCDRDKCGICLHHMPATGSCVTCNTTIAIHWSAFMRINPYPANMENMMSS